MKMDKITSVEQIGGPTEGELIRDSFLKTSPEIQELLKRAGQTTATRIDKARDAELIKKGINPAQKKLNL